MSLFDEAQAFLFKRRTAYNTTFRNPFGEVVLEDLAKFCRAHKTTWEEAVKHDNAHLAAKMDGRREVWLRIQHHLRLTDEQLWKLYK